MNELEKLKLEMEKMKKKAEALKKANDEIVKKLEEDALSVKKLSDAKELELQTALDLSLSTPKAVEPKTPIDAPGELTLDKIKELIVSSQSEFMKNMELAKAESLKVTEKQKATDLLATLNDEQKAKIGIKDLSSVSYSTLKQLTDHHLKKTGIKYYEGGGENGTLSNDDYLKQAIANGNGENIKVVK